jgi:hypothetical protein
MSADPNMAQRFRRRAEELWTMAADEAGLGIRHHLQRLAADYEQLALSAEALDATDRVLRRGLHVGKKSSGHRSTNRGL